MKIINIIFLCLFSQSLFARLLVDVTVMNKKGIDIGLTLGSELHATEEVTGDQAIVLQLKSGLKVVLLARFSTNTSDQFAGPVESVVVSGKVTNENGDPVKELMRTPTVIQLNETKEFSHSFATQLIEIKVKPYLQ